MIVFHVLFIQLTGHHKVSQRAMCFNPLLSMELKEVCPLWHFHRDEVQFKRTYYSNFGHFGSEILKKVTFTKTDSAAHNIGVMDLVCSAVNIENIPQQLFCNVHPLIMFQNRMKRKYVNIFERS